MIRVALRGVIGRKLRATLTALAIVLGVAMVSGTYVFTDTMEKAIDSLFTDAYTGSDAVISGKDVVEASASGDATVPAALLARVEALPEVDSASGGIVDYARLIGKDGEPISTAEEGLGLGVDAGAPQFNPLRLTEGRWPSGTGEIAIDAATARREGFAAGETISVVARGAAHRFTISGFAELTSLDSIGALTFAIFDVPTAQAFFDKTGQFDEIYLAAKDGITPDALVREIAPLLPPTAEVASGQDQMSSEAAGSNEDIAIVQKILLAFGGLALFVGGFVIFNTLSTTIAQRTRELATLRTLGASRRQVLGSVMVESLAIGVVASAIGLFVGVGLAKGLTALFVAVGQELPQTGSVLAARTVVVSLLAGVAITLVSGLFPALRATGVPPISAVREGALPRSPLAPYVQYIAAAAAALGVGLLAVGMFAPGLSVRAVLVCLAAGCLILFLGVAMVSSRLVRPLAAVVGRPMVRLARENAVRNPGRTAVTASSLMIGLALVTFVAVLGKGLQDSVGNAVEGTIRADYVVTGGLTPEAERELASVARVSGVREESASVFGSDESVAAVDPGTIGAFMRFDWDAGSFAGLGTNGAVVQREFADEHGLDVGSAFSLRTPQGRDVELTVRGIYTPPKLDPILGPVIVSQRTFDASFERPRNAFVFADGNGQTLATALGRFPEGELQTRAEFAAEREKEIETTLQVLYVLLALSILVSLFGMVNTVVLSVFERTRELGMLRAIGMTRRQLRRMIRHESVITALIGAALGLPLGMFLAALVTLALEDEGVAFSVPAATIVVFALTAIVAGIVAAILPARRAARLEVLEALQYE